jgi:hypothetical protein
VTAAIFGLLGVIVGGLVTGGVNYIMERRRERAELRQAKRLVADELLTVATQYSIMVEDRETPKKWSPSWANLLPSTSWEQHKATLARGLSDKDWADLPGFYSIVEAYRSSLLGGGPEQPIADEQLRQLDAELDSAARLYSILTGTLAVSVLVRLRPQPQDQ